MLGYFAAFGEVRSVDALRALTGMVDRVDFVAGDDTPLVPLGERQKLFDELHAHFANTFDKGARAQSN